jgi:hypothetical protein
LLDRTLIVSERHLDVVLREYLAHYNLLSCAETLRMA